MTGIEEVGMLSTFLNGLYEKYKNREAALTLIEELSKISREGFIEISGDSLRKSGVAESLATEDNVHEFVLKVLKKEETPGTAIIYQTYDDKLAPAYMVHVLGESAANGHMGTLRRFADLEIRRNYFHSKDVTIIKTWTSPQEEKFNIAEAEELANFYRNVDTNFKYVSCGREEQEPELVAECFNFSVEDKINAHLAKNTGLSRSR